MLRTYRAKLRYFEVILTYLGSRVGGELGVADQTDLLPGLVRLLSAPSRLPGLHPFPIENGPNLKVFGEAKI